MSEINKVVYGDDTLIDLTNDTVTSDTLLSGVTAHDKSGATITGAMVVNTDYTELENKPSINGVELNGDISTDDLKAVFEVTGSGNSYTVSNFSNDLAKKFMANKHQGMAKYLSRYYQYYRSDVADYDDAITIHYFACVDYMRSQTTSNQFYNKFIQISLKLWTGKITAYTLENTSFLQGTLESTSNKIDEIGQSYDNSQYPTVNAVKNYVYGVASTKQDSLVSGGTIKTINGESILGAGDLTVITDISGKQDTISDLSTIRSNASAGKGASDTIATYGNIVTHNASEFATKGDIPTVDVTKNYVDTEVAKKQDSINDLATIRSNATNAIKQGDTLTAPLKVTGGDGSTSGKIILDQTGSGQITNNGESTLLGFTSNNSGTFVVGSSSYATNVRGGSTRPTYNGNELALKSDVPTSSVTGCLPVDSSNNSFVVDNVYDASLKCYRGSTGQGSPKNILYGALLTMPYRKGSGNTKVDFAAQMFFPNGDDSPAYKDSFFYRTGLSTEWNDWQQVGGSVPAIISNRSADKSKDHYLHWGVAVAEQGYGLAWYTNSNTNRYHFIFNRIFKKGTKIKFIGDWTGTRGSSGIYYIFALTMGGGLGDAQKTDVRGNDSGWTSSSTADKTFSGDVGLGFKFTASDKSFTIPYDGYIGINVKKSDGNAFTDLPDVYNWLRDNFVIEGNIIEPNVLLHSAETIDPADLNQNMNVVNHRGWNYEGSEANGGCPENTLSAYRESKRRGFTMVECDVGFTSNGVPMLLHDRSINRTGRNADGTSISNTINLDSITDEQARTYDFGIAKGQSFAGEKIPYFKEFIILCKNLGLHPYIELKTSPMPSSSEIDTVLDIVKKAGMKGKVTYISFNATTVLQMVKQKDPKARLGYVVGSHLTVANAVADTVALRTGTNEVFVDSDISWATEELANACAEQDLPLEVWTPNSIDELSGKPVYISGVTTNVFNLHKARMNENGFFF